MKTMKALFVLLLTSSAIAAQALPVPVVFHVSLGQASATSVSGRLLVFAKPLGPADKRPVAAVNMDQIDTHATAIAATSRLTNTTYRFDPAIGLRSPILPACSRCCSQKTLSLRIENRPNSQPQSVARILPETDSPVPNANAADCNTAR